MLSKTSSPSGPPAANRPTATPILLTPKQAARYLNLSVSWLAKRRLAGDGPPYVKLGGAVRLRGSLPPAVDEGPAAHLDQRMMPGDE